MSAFHNLTISNINKESADAVTVSFQIPADLKSAFNFKAGQYITLRFQLNGQEARRSYSMSSSPIDNEISVTVKKVAGGLVSNHIMNLKANDTVEVMPPDGRFFAVPDVNSRKTYYLIGAGSGITPLMSILRTIIEEEPKSEVHLLYGNKTEESIIFKNQLDELLNRYQGQITVTHTLSQAKKKGGLLSMFKKSKSGWEGWTGRIDGSMINKFLSEKTAKGSSSEFFICGPGDMIQAAEKHLQAKGFDKSTIHREYFTAADSGSTSAGTTTAGAGGTIKLTAHASGQEVTIDLDTSKTILDNMLDNNHEVPYSCRSGACATCIAKIIKGTVDMEISFGLDDDEIAEGFILTCQSTVTSDEIEITYDE